MLLKRRLHNPTLGRAGKPGGAGDYRAVALRQHRSAVQPAWQGLLDCGPSPSIAAQTVGSASAGAWKAVILRGRSSAGVIGGQQRHVEGWDLDP